MQRWIPSLAAAVALAGSASLCQAQPITYDFNSGMPSAFYDGGPAGATYTVNPTGGPDGSGCLQAVFDGVTTTEIDPAFNASFNGAQYLSVSFQMKVDASSGKTGTGGSGGYGNLQVALRDAGFSWNSIWYGTIYPPAANGWVTYTFVIAQPYISVAHVQIQLQGGTYSAPVTAYIDNVTITPVPNPWIIDPFTSDTSSGYSQEGWTGAPGTCSLNTSQDAGGGHTPLGALQMDIAWPVAAQWTAWGQSWISRAQAMDPSRYTYFECDVMVDAANSTPYSGGDYGSLTIALRDGNSYGGPYDCAPGSISLDSSYTSWKHLKLALPTAGNGGNPITNSPAYDIELRGNYMGPVRIYFDNITVSKPVTAPRIVGLLPGTQGGLKINVDADGTANQFDQEGISSTSGDNAGTNFFWIAQTPATYSFTITNFPAPASPFSSTPTAPVSVGAGFDTHVYIVNGDSITANGNVGSWGYNQTYSGVPYNALDYIGMRVQNASITNEVTYTTNNSVITTNNSYSLGSGVVAILEWKTNLPSANAATNVTRFRFPSMASANGTWSLNFSDNTHGNIVAADGSVHSFTLPDFVNDPNYTANFNPATSMVQFGVSKNDAVNTGANNNLSATFTHVLVSNAVLGTIYDDSFNGPGLTGKYAWQVAEYYLDAADRAKWQPYGTAYWLEWGEPAAGYTVQSAASLTGSWGDASVTYTYADPTGTNHFGAIPTASLPAGNTAFFRLTK